MQLDPLNDRLIPDPQVRQRYGVTDMTLWRWDHTPSLGFPPADPHQQAEIPPPQ